MSNQADKHKKEISLTGKRTTTWLGVVVVANLGLNPTPTVGGMANPNPTLYIKNLNDGINKDELRAQLYALFLPHGPILDVVALKTAKMRGQAFVVFQDMIAATAALRAWQGEMFYDKPMVRIHFPSQRM